MKGIKLKITLIFLMLVPVPFSCKDKNECLDLYVEPYYNMLGIVFTNVDIYYRTITGTPMFDAEVSQDYNTQVYPCDSMALNFITPDTLLMYHSQNIRTSFGFTQEAYAECQRPGYAGTLDLVDKIYISSNYDFDETHNRTDNLSDIVEILHYTPNVKEQWKSLSEFNKNSPYVAAKRFTLFFKRKPTKSNVQQFVIRYYVKTEEGGTSKHFDIVTPVFHVR